MTSYRSTALVALLGAAILSLAALPARADSTVGVVVTGEATMQPQLVAQIETWLRSHGHDLISAPLAPDAINALIDCFVIEDQACARKVVEKRAKSRAVVFAQVSVTAGATALDRTVTLTVYWLDKGKDAFVERRSCERCNDNTMRHTADELMIALDGASSSRGTLKLTSTPPGAKVTVDGKPLGKTPFDQSLSTGDHKLVLELAGWLSETRSVSVKKDQTVKVEVALTPEPPPPSRVPGILTLVGGVAMGAAGGVLIKIDQDPDPSITTREIYRDTALGGVALAAAGAAVIGAGVYLLVRKPKPARASAPAVGLASGSGFIGWTGRF